MDESLDDLEYINDFLLDAGVYHAEDIKEHIISSATRLNNFLLLGVKVHSSSTWGDIRDFFSGNYCLRYGFYECCIYILRIWRQKENERNF